MGIDSSPTADLSRFDQQCLTEFFLHKMGYTFDGGRGNIKAVTEAEKYRLWNGFGLWHEHVENYDESSRSPEGTSGKARTAGKLDAETKRKWDAFSQKVDA